MSNSIITIDLKPVADVATNLLDKLSQAIGWIFTHETPEKIAINTYIEEIQSGDYSPLEKYAYVSNHKKILKGYCNQRNIVELAMLSLSEKACPQNVDDDWLAQFMNKTQFVSDEVFQQIWAKILAQECNEPNSVPKSLLHILEQMEKTDAEVFSALCMITIHTDIERHPVVNAECMEKYAQIGITYEKLVDLEALGLVTIDMLNGYQITGETEGFEFKYFQRSFKAPSTKKDIRLGGVIYTRAGQALSRCIKVENDGIFFDSHCYPLIFSDKLDLTI